MSRDLAGWLRGASDREIERALNDPRMAPREVRRASDFAEEAREELKRRKQTPTPQPDGGERQGLGVGGGAGEPNQGLIRLLLVGGVVAAFLMGG